MIKKIKISAKPSNYYEKIIILKCLFIRTQINYGFKNNKLYVIILF